MHDGEAGERVRALARVEWESEKIRFLLIISNYVSLPVAQKSCHYSDEDNVVELQESESFGWDQRYL